MILAAIFVTEALPIVFGRVEADGGCCENRRVFVIAPIDPFRRRVPPAVDLAVSDQRLDSTSSRTNDGAMQ
jgi:hypothetical protein